MLKKYSLIFFIQLLILSFLFLSCDDKQKDVEVININPEKNSNSNIDAEILSVIRLETNDNTLIGKIDKIIYFNDKIYILDVWYSKALFVFNFDGSLHAKTKLGRGPGEVINPFSFSVNKSTNEVMLWDQNLSSMFYYDLNLNYLRNEKYNFNVRDFEQMGKDTFLVMSYKLKNSNDKKKLTTYSIYTDNFSIALGHFLPVNMDQETQSTLKPMSNYSQMLFIKPWDNNIYSFIANEIQVKYKFDFGKYNIDNYDLELSNSERWDKVRSGQRIGSLFNLSESENFITVLAFYNKRVNTFVYSKKQKNAIKLNAISTLPQCEILCNFNNVNDAFIAEVKDRNFSGVTQNDNPVLIMFKLIDKP
jgi:hypothetical protein